MWFDLRKFLAQKLYQRVLRGSMEFYFFAAKEQRNKALARALFLCMLLYVILRVSTMCVCNIKDVT